MIKSKGFLVLLSTISSGFCFPFPNISHDPNKVRFLVYADPSDRFHYEEIFFHDLPSLHQSPFKPNAATVFCTHGFLDSAEPNALTFIAFKEFGGVHNVTRAYLQSGFTSDKNYVVIDWGPLAGYIESPLDVLPLYIGAMGNIPIVARRISDFVQWLISENYMDPNNLHLIGHSLGAYVMGYVGRNLKKEIIHPPGFKVPRITGIDPAGPFYPLPDPERRLSKNDAAFVDVIHTNVGEYGDVFIDGHVDFFPNGGKSMPGCNLAFDIAFCSHLYVWKLFAASFTNQYLCCKCSRFLDPLRLRDCMGVCEGGSMIIGPNTPPSARGSYYCYVPPFP